MKFIKASCPSCGGDIELDKDKDTGFCSYCGSKIVKDKILVEHNGNISLNGLANEKSLIERAFLFIEDHSFINAEKYFERVLDINPHCSQAYIGKLMCKLCVTNIQDLKHQIIPLESYKEYSLATRFATPEELQNYQELNQKTLANLDEAIKNLIAQKKSYKDELSSLEKKESKYDCIFFLTVFLSVLILFTIPKLGFTGFILFILGGIVALIYKNASKEIDSKISATQSIISQKNKEIRDLSDNDPRRNR